MRAAVLAFALAADFLQPGLRVRDGLQVTEEAVGGDGDAAFTELAERTTASEELAAEVRRVSPSFCDGADGPEAATCLKMVEHGVLCKMLSENKAARWNTPAAVAFRAKCKPLAQAGFFKVAQWVEHPGKFFNGLTDKAQQDGDAADPPVALPEPDDPAYAKRMQARTKERDALLDSSADAFGGITRDLEEEIRQIKHKHEV